MQLVAAGEAGGSHAVEAFLEGLILAFKFAVVIR